MLLNVYTLSDAVLPRIQQDLYAYCVFSYFLSAVSLLKYANWGDYEGDVSGLSMIPMFRHIDFSIDK